jgi:protein SCO1/2
LNGVGKGLLAGAVVVTAAVMAFAIFEPIQVLPRIRLSPGFAFIDQNRGAFTSDDGRGALTLYAFAPADCGPRCADMHQTMKEVGEQVAHIDLGGVEFRRITVALDTSDPEDLSVAASESGADGSSWRWVGAQPAHLRDVVGRGFRVYYEVSGAGEVDFYATYVIVDGEGVIRGEYSYATIASDAQRLSRHIGLLGKEIRNAEGSTALLYEAAHVFLCYP